MHTITLAIVLMGVPVGVNASWATIGRVLPFIADYLTGSQLHFLNMEIRFHDRADPRRADCGHHECRLDLCTVCKIAKCSKCTPADCLCPCPWS